MCLSVVAPSGGRRRRHGAGLQWRAAALGLLSLWLPSIALAEEAGDGTDGLAAVAGAKWLYDSNLFRLRDGRTPPAGSGSAGRSEQVVATLVGLRFDKAYSQQRLRVDAGLVDYRYANNGYLDYVARNYGATWNWAVTPSIFGSLAVNHSQVLNSFSDYQAYATRNVRTTDSRRFEAEMELTPRWHLLAGVGQLEQTNSQRFDEEADFRQTAPELGIKYAGKPGSFLSLVRREADGSYFKRQLIPLTMLPMPANPLLDTEFRQHENELRLRWEFAGKSTLDARLGYLERQHGHFAARDYRGTVAQLDYLLAATPKLQLRLGLRRALAPFQSDYASYYRSTAVVFAPAWRLSERTTLRASYLRERRDFGGPVLAGLPGRDDVVRSGMLALDWLPARRLSLSLTVQQESRQSSMSALDYSDLMVGIGGQLAF